MKDETKIRLFDMMAEMGHEQLVFCRDDDAGYRGIIAIHSTALGPAVGGTRFWNYPKEQDAIIDALRLSRGMTYKCAAAGMALGGGKSIIISGNEPVDRGALFRAHGRFVERLGGRYITAEDVGSSAADMKYIALETKHVGGLAGQGAGDPSPWTALGAFRAMQAAAKYRWGSDDLREKRVAVQGCGNVGYHLARELREAGARLIVSDVDPERMNRAVKEFDAEPTTPDSIHAVTADILAPCALGGTINAETIPQLNIEIICGAANNQLLTPKDGYTLEQRGILYAPDYVVNSGGVLSGGADLFGWSIEKVRTKVLAIYDTLLSVFELSKSEGIPTYKAADRLAEGRLRDGNKHPWRVENSPSPEV